MTRRQDYRLTDAGVKAIAKQSTPTKVTRHGDGNNLYLIQHPNGSLFWQMTYRYQSPKDLKPKQKTYQIGISLHTTKKSSPPDFHRFRG